MVQNSCFLKGLLTYNNGRRINNSYNVIMNENEMKFLSIFLCPKNYLTDYFFLGHFGGVIMDLTILRSMSLLNS